MNNMEALLDLGFGDLPLLKCLLCVFQMVWQNSGMFSNVDSMLVLPVEACSPRDSSTVSSTVSVRKKKRRATGAMVKKFNGLFLYNFFKFY